MPVAEIIALVQILSGLGGAAVDITKIVEAIKKDGRTQATDDEVAKVKAILQPHADAIDAATTDGPASFLGR